MKNTLRKLEIFPAFDGDGIAKRLEKMAEMGWMLEKMCPFYWLYRRAEPKKLVFHVSFFPAFSPFAPSPVPGEEEFSDMCDHSGWKLVAKGGRMSVFCAEDGANLPIDTDPVVETAAIHSVAMRTAVPMGAAILLCAVYMLIGAVRELLGGASMFGLSTVSVAFCGVLSALAAIYYALELAAYFSWYTRARRAAVTGKRVRYTKIGGALRFLQWSAFVTCLVWSVCAAIFAAGPERFLIALIPWAFVTFDRVSGLTDALRRAGVSRGLNRALTLLASAACYAALFIAVA